MYLSPGVNQSQSYFTTDDQSVSKPIYNNEVVFSFWSVLRLLLGSDNNEVVFCPFRGCYRKRRNSAVIFFQKDPTKAATYWTSQPELQKDEVVESRPV
jgi:hypothetical protein